MLFAELAKLRKLDPVRIVLLVFERIIISLFALGACKRYFISVGSSHLKLPPKLPRRAA